MEGALARLIESVRARFVRNLVLEQAVTALTIALVGAVALLLAGTQILDWYWPVLLFGGALAYGLWRVRERLPRPYSVAQRIDRELSLADSLSTAWHYRSETGEIPAAQRAQAESLASKVDPSAAAPLVWPRSARWCALAAAAALGLFGARYGVQKSLDLKRPLVAFGFDDFGSSQVADARTGQKAPSIDEFMRTVSVQPVEDQKQDGLEPAPDSALGVADIPDVNNVGDDQAPGKTGEKGPGMGDGKDQNEGTENSEGAAAGNEKGEDQGKQGSNNEGKQGEQKAGGKADQPGENSSLMDKMKDALANMMSKLNQPQKPGGEQQQQPGNSKTGQQSANARQGQKQGQMPSKGQPSGDQQANNQQQGQPSDEDADPSQATQGKPGDKNSQSASNQENKSGVGKQDGDKDVKLAEQLAAMGKISEIIGKRNNNLQGELMVEVNSSKQQLRTQYTQRAAKHAESGAEIRRDEVPLIYQEFVQQYFEEVRKTPAPPPPAPAAAKGPARPSFPAEIP